MNLSTTHLCTVIYIAIMTPSANTSPTTELQTSDTSRFQLVILKQNTFSLRLGYDAEEALPKLLAVNLKDNIFIVGLNEIESYDWTSQSITLTSQATAHLRHALSLRPESDEGITDLNAMKKSLNWGNPFEHALYVQAFVVVIDGAPTYGGIFLDAMSQMAIKFPVIRVEIIDSKVVFHLLPVHIPFLTYDAIPVDNATYDGVIAPEGAGDWVSFPEEMKERFLRIGTTTQAQELRQVIRNPAVRDIMEKSGKLRK